MLYDYSGFPKQTYSVSWPAPGAPNLVGEVESLLAGLADWAQAPMARAAHPREEHLLPLHVCAGAGGEDLATFPYRDVMLGVDTR